MPYNTYQPNYAYQNYPQYPQNYPQQQYIPQTPYMPQNSQQNQQVNNLPQQPQTMVSSPKFDIVQGELAANMYQTENGQEVILIDMDNPYVYKKKRGLDGKLEPMEKFKLVKEEEHVEPTINLKDFVRQEEIESIVEKLVKNEVDKKLSEMTLKPSTRKTKSEE